MHIRALANTAWPGTEGTLSHSSATTQVPQRSSGDFCSIPSTSPQILGSSNENQTYWDGLGLAPLSWTHPCQINVFMQMYS